MKGRITISWQGGKRKRKKTWFLYAPRQKEKQRMLLLFAVLVCVAGLVTGLVHVIGYARDYAVSKRQTQELRNVYYAAAQTATPAPAATETPRQEKAAEPTDAPATKKPAILTAVHYPQNFQAHVQARFTALKQKNPDITGWLKIGTHLDEPVVQRDNSHYLRRDYLGNPNSNGTLFLDQDIQWNTRPYTLMIYGHNMKSGAMFGHLKSYEKYDYLLEHAIITFDTAYEDGRYVVFAVGTYSLNAGDAHPLNLGRLDSRTVSVREKELEKLLKGAVTTSPVDVQAQDQLLLLITCVDDDNERRILAARRIRENESEEELLAQMYKARAN